MDELAKALAEAVKTGADLAWPAVVMYFVVEALTPLAVVTTMVLSTWLICRAVLQYPVVEARSEAEKRRVEADTYRTRCDMEVAKEKELRAIRNS